MTHRPPTPLARAAIAARTRGQAKAGASQDPQREPEPERRKEPVEVGDDDDEDGEDERLRQEEDRRAEQRARKRGCQEEAEPVLHDSTPKKKKYAVQLEEGFDVERVIDRLLEGHNDLMTLKEILASAPRLHNELKGRLSRRLVPNVYLSVILPKEVEWADSGMKMDWKCVACGMVDLVVKGSKCAAMVDTGAEMNIIREADTLRFGLEINRLDCGILHRANCKAVFCGTASNVLLDIERVKAITCFFVIPDVDHDILLGISFLCRTETLMFNKHDGSLILILCDPSCGNYEVITCRNTGPRSIRNKPNPDSFTIEESEDERRRLMAELKGEVREEAFSLSLSDVKKVMDLVVTHEMTDSGVIQATSFDRYLMLEGDVEGKKIKEEGHGVRLEALQAEIQDLRALATSQTAIIQSLLEERKKERAPTKVVDQKEGAQYDVQEQVAQGSEQPSEAGSSQGPSLGKLILGPEEAKAKREAEKEAFVFKASTEFATLPVEPLGVRPTSSPLPGEAGSQGAASEPAQGSMEGPMGVLLEALDTMQEEASTPMSELGTESVSEELPVVVSGEM
ncbi:hypothetical protein CBR_g41399 [Chara braunii]|uniref:Aspartic peptidase DDI1-type domain-containing protein n=1 Tax=Chara braunii TaxID=69332 RepID=A0A388LVX7_CHABU|nr:hypothetical protein CBR_g41399 [Chara braunii]|eukprot:GBG86403.1 hypothetical protein CBR_g41399 [Chara braunii]